MAVEVLSGKLFAPFYGTSLYVWTSVFGVTMIGLATGYYFGGKISTYDNPHKKLRTVLLISIFSVLFMTYIGELILVMSLNFPLRLGIFLSSLIVMLPAIVSFGMVTPLIIRLLSFKNQNAGWSSGLIYGLSTIGGILFTFSFGFYFIFSHGVYYSFLLVVVLLIVAFCFSLQMNPYEK